MTFADVQAAWADAIAAAVEAAGITDVVVSPGSRSTPLVLALRRRSGLRLTPIVDERSAAFFALGQARWTEQPSLLVCTSGSAAAHYLPAIVEASEAGVPLVAITADRPPELHDRGTNQTIRQDGIFGRFARRSINLGVAESSATATRALTSRVLRSVALSRGPVPGPVHLNAPFRKPLEPERSAPVPSLGEPPPTPFEHPGRVVAAEAALGELEALVRESRRGLLVVGPAPLSVGRVADDIRELAAATGFTLLAETTSQLRDDVRVTRSGRGFRRCDCFDLVFGTPELRARLRPDAVIQIGRAPVSTNFAALMRESDGVHHVLLDPAGYHDPTATVGQVVRGDLADVCHRLSTALEDFAPDADYGAALEDAAAGAWSAVLGALLDRGDALTEATVARTLVAELPDGGPLVVGNSLAVRDLDWFCPALPSGVGVLSQRGASGIDGLISAAAGVASATLAPTTLYLGDVSFLHDLHGLLATRHARGPLVILVANNDGGRIFERLPIAASPAVDEDFERLWVMPHGCSATDLARACGVRSTAADTVAELHDALRAAYEHGGVAVVEARIGRDATGADHTRALPAAHEGAARGGAADHVEIE